MKELTASEKALIERLPGDLKRVAEIAGIENAIRLAKAFRGTYIYIGNFNSIARELRDLRIRRDFDSGMKTRRLAIKYGLTERSIWSILSSTGDITPDALEVIEGVIDEPMDPMSESRG